jgi:hypothetical protein
VKRTNRKTTLLALFIIAVVTVLPLTARGQCDHACDLPPKAERGDCWIVIDANTGTVREGSIRFSDRCEQVRVYYVNKNPFKYSYSFTSKFVPYDTETALAFLKLIPGFGETVKSVAEPASNVADTACSGTDLAKSRALKKRALDLAAKFKSDSESLATSVNNALASYNTYKTNLGSFFDKTDNDNAFASGSDSCAQLCQLAKDRLAEYAGLPDLEALGIKVDGFDQKVTAESEITKLEADINAFQPSAANGGDDCRTETVNAAMLVINQIRDASKTAKTRLAELKKAKETLDQKTKIVKAGASDSFVEVVPAQRDDSRGGKLTLNIARKNLRNPDSKLDDRTVTLLIGEPSLFLTAGIGFSTVSDRRVIRQAALVSDGKGGTKLGTVFGFDENSNFKPSGVFMLTAPLKRFGNGMTIGPSAGLVISSRNGTTEPEFIAGLSLGLLRNTVFISGGFHAARRESLASGFKIGQEVPADLKDPLPLEKRFTGGAMFSITYRIK